MEGIYLTQKDGESLSFPYDWHQTFAHPFEMARVANEAVVVKMFVSDAEERQIGLEILVLLLDYTFATKAQLQRLLKAKGIAGIERLDSILEKYLATRIINCFTLSQFPMDHIPDDAFLIYCLDHASRHILSHFYRDDVAVTWRSTNALRSAMLASKYLATNEFYISLLGAKQKSLVSFQPTVNYTVRNRDIRFSAAFRIMRGSTPRDFILEAVRGQDIPTYWEKKVGEQIAPFVLDKFWSRYFRQEPVFIFLAEDLKQAEELSAIFSRGTGSSNFRVTTDRELLKGIQNAMFYKFDADTQKLVQVNATIFKSDD